MPQSSYHKKCRTYLTWYVARRQYPANRHANEWKFLRIGTISVRSGLGQQGPLGVQGLADLQSYSCTCHTGGKAWFEDPRMERSWSMRAGRIAVVICSAACTCKICMESGSLSPFSREPSFVLCQHRMEISPSLYEGQSRLLQTPGPFSHNTIRHFSLVLD